MDIRLPNGHIIRNVPEGTSKELIREKAIKAGVARPEDFPDFAAPFPPAEDTRESGFIPSLVKGAKSLASSTQTGLGSLFGSSEEAALAGLERERALDKQYTPGMDLGKVGKAFTEEGFLAAAKEVLSQSPTAVAETSPYMAAMGAGAIAGAPFAGLTGGLSVPIGSMLAVLPSIYGGEIERQAAVQQAEGEPVDIKEGRALASATAQAGLETAAAALPFVGKRLVAGIFGKSVEELSKRSTKEVVQELTKIAEKSRLRAAGKGVGVAAVAEPITEVTQSMLSRAQAGQDLFSDDALSEYGQAAYGAALASPIGAIGGMYERSAATDQLGEINTKLDAVADIMRREFPEGPHSAMRFQKALQIPLSQAKDIREALVDRGDIVTIEGQGRRLKPVSEAEAEAETETKAEAEAAPATPEATLVPGAETPAAPAPLTVADLIRVPGIRPIVPPAPPEAIAPTEFTLPPEVLPKIEEGEIAPQEFVPAQEEALNKTIAKLREGTIAPNPVGIRNILGGTLTEARDIHRQLVERGDIIKPKNRYELAPVVSPVQEAVTEEATPAEAEAVGAAPAVDLGEAGQAVPTVPTEAEVTPQIEGKKRGKGTRRKGVAVPVEPGAEVGAGTAGAIDTGVGGIGEGVADGVPAEGRGDVALAEAPAVEAPVAEPAPAAPKPPTASPALIEKSIQTLEQELAGKLSKRDRREKTERLDLFKFMLAQAKGEKPKLSRTELPVAGIPAERAKAKVQELTSGWKNAPQITVINSVADLDAQGVSSAAVPADTDGMITSDGRVFVIAENISDDGQLRAVVFHESLGHFGLQGRFQKALSNLLSNIYRTNAKVRQAADEWVRDQMSDPDGKAFYASLTKAELQRRAVEEVLAERSESGGVKADPGWRGAIARVAALLRDFGRLMGLDVKYSDADVANVLRKAHEYVTKGKKSPVESMTDRLMYVGEIGADATARKAIHVAKQMAKAGAGREQVRLATGAFQGPDGKWRYEVSDSRAELNPVVLAGLLDNPRYLLPTDPKDAYAFIKKYVQPAGIELWLEANRDTFAQLDPMDKPYEAKKLEEWTNAEDLPRIFREAYGSGFVTKDFGIKRGQGAVSLDTILKHPMLYKMYPGLKDVQVEYKYDPDQIARFTGDKVIINRDDIGKSELKATLLHEIQHYIQASEGFSFGTSPQAFRGPILSDLLGIYRGFGSSQFINKLPLFWERNQNLSGIWRKPNEKALAEILVNSIKHSGAKYHEALTVYQNDAEAERYAADLADAVSKLSEIIDIPFARYYMQYGEAEARDVESRMGLTQKELRGTPRFERERKSGVTPEEYEDTLVFQPGAERMFLSRRPARSRPKSGGKWLQPQQQRSAFNNLKRFVTRKDAFDRGLTLLQNQRRPWKVLDDYLSKGERIERIGADANNVYEKMTNASGLTENNILGRAMPPIREAFSALRDYAKATGISLQEAVDSLGMKRVALHEVERRLSKYYENVPLNNIIKFLIGGKTYTPATLRDEIYLTVIRNKNLTDQDLQQLQQTLAWLVDNYKEAGGYSKTVGPTAKNPLDIKSDNYQVVGYSLAELRAERMKYNRDPNKQLIDEFFKKWEAVLEAQKELDREGNFWTWQVDNLSKLYGYKYYVPFKGLVGKEFDSKYEFNSGSRLGGSYSESIDKAEGRSSEVNNPFYQTMSDTLRAAGRAGRVDVLPTVQNVIKQKHIKGNPLVKNITFEDKYLNGTPKDIKTQDHVFKPNPDGSFDVIQIGEDKYLEGLKGFTSDVGAAWKVAGAITSFIGRGLTFYNPFFHPLNFVRDAFTNAWNAASRFGPSTSFQMIGTIAFNVVRSGLFSRTLAASWRYQTGGIEAIKDMKGKFGNDLRDYLAGGGRVAFSKSFSTEAQEQELLESIGPGKFVRSKAVIDRVMSSYADAFEMTSRVGSFTVVRDQLKAIAKKQGKNPNDPAVKVAINEEAVAFAKNLFNYEEVGKYGREIGSYLIFMRPTLTSAARTWDAILPVLQNAERQTAYGPDTMLGTSPEAIAMRKAYVKNMSRERRNSLLAAGSLLAIGAGGYMLALAAAPDDEQGRNIVASDDMNQWTRALRLPVKLPGDRNEFINIPWGFGFTAFAALGAQIASFFVGNQTFKDFLGNLIPIATDSFIPLPTPRFSPFESVERAGAFAVDTMMPSFARPVLELVMNVDALGREIYNEQINRYGTAYSGRGNVPPAINDFTAWLAEKSAGEIELNPNVINFLLTNYLNAGSYLINTIYGIGQVAADEKDFDIKRDALVLGSFIGKKSDVNAREYSKYIAELEPRIATMRSLEGREGYVEFMQRNPTLLTQKYLYDKVNNGILRDIEGRINQIEKKVGPYQYMTPDQRKMLLDDLTFQKGWIQYGFISQMKAINPD